MIFDNFKLHAVPEIREAYCSNKKCRGRQLTEVSNGFLSIAMFCQECKKVYTLQLVQYKKASKEFIQQCEDQIAAHNASSEARYKFYQKVDRRKAAERDKRLSRKPKKK